MSGLLTRYGMLCAAALLATLLAAGGWCRAKNLGYGVWIRFCVLAVPLCWLCSRVVYCLGNIPYFFIEMERPGLMLRFWEGGGTLFGALGGLMLAAWLAARWTHVSAGTLLDGAAFGAPLGVIIARLAEIGTDIGVGDPIVAEWLLPLGVTDSLRHPVYLYEAVAAGAIFLVLLGRLAASKGRRAQEGDTALIFLTLYGCVQVVLESLRDDGHLVVHHFVHLNQIIAIVLPVIAAAVWGARCLKKGTKKAHVVAVWLVTAAMIGVGIAAEFAVDRSDSKLVAYGVMSAAMAVIAFGALYLRRKAESIISD